MFAVLLVSVLAADPEPPRFVVENKMPRFEVVNKMPAPATSEVVVQPFFTPGGDRTTVLPVAAQSIAYPAGYRTGSTRTPVGLTGRFGLTSAGCVTG